MRPRPSGRNTKPTSAPRWRIISRVAACCCGEDPYFCAMCSPMSWPSGPICGLSSKGWKWIRADSSSCRRPSAASSAPSPMAHQGQETSETKSIRKAGFMGVVSSACRSPDLTAWANPPPARGIAPRYTGRSDAAAIRGRPFDPTPSAMPDRFELLRRRFIQGTPQMMDIGLEATRLETNRASMSMPPRPDWMGDPARDLMHPGAITVLADSCCGLAVATALETQVTFATLDLRMDYLRPASPSRTTYCDAQCYRISRSVAFVRAE